MKKKSKDPEAPDKESVTKPKKTKKKSKEETKGPKEETKVPKEETKRPKKEEQIADAKQKKSSDVTKVESPKSSSGERSRTPSVTRRSRLPVPVQRASPKRETSHSSDRETRQQAKDDKLTVQKKTIINNVQTTSTKQEDIKSMESKAKVKKIFCCFIWMHTNNNTK